MGKNQDPGSGISITDPQHCFQVISDLILKQGHVIKDKFDEYCTVDKTAARFFKLLFNFSKEIST
jgi:hypothetical protein